MEDYKKEFDQLQKEAWEEEDKYRGILTYLLEHPMIKIAGYYVSDEPWYNILYLGDGEGNAWALPGFFYLGEEHPEAYCGYLHINEDKDIERLLRTKKLKYFHSVDSETKEEAKEFAMFGIAEIVDEKIISQKKEKNQYDENIVTEEVRELKMRTPMGRILTVIETEYLSCYSSMWVGMGTCRCETHPTYRVERKLVSKQ